MKKRVAVLLGMVLMASSVLAGCGGSEYRVATGETTTAAKEETEKGTEATGTLKP